MKIARSPNPSLVFLTRRRADKGNPTAGNSSCARQTRRQIRKHSPALLILLACCAVCEAVEGEKPPAPRISITETQVDIGVIDDPALAHHRFVIANRGDAPLHISIRSLSCRCVVSSFEDQIVQPSNQVALSLRYVPESANFTEGPLSWSVVLGTNDPQSPILALSVQATVSPILSVQPEKIDFGDLALGATAKSEFEVIVMPEFAPLSVRPQRPDLLTVELLSSERVSRRIVNRYRALFRSERYGEQTTVLRVRTTRKDHRGLEVPVQAYIDFPLDIEPDRVDFGQVRRGSASRFRVRLKPEEGGNRLPSRAKCPDPRIGSNVMIDQSGLQATVEVYVREDAARGVLNTSIDLYSPDSVRVGVIPVNGFVAGNN